MGKIAENKIIKLHFKGTLDDGSIFDSSENSGPLEFVFGRGVLIPGLEEEIKGLKIGDRKLVVVPVDKAYGPRQEDATQEVAIDQLPKETELKIGVQLSARDPSGVISASIVEVKAHSVIVDFNHPLAGKQLTYDIEVVDIFEAREEDIQKYTTPPGESF